MVPCPAVRCCTVACCVLCCTYSFVQPAIIPSIIPSTSTTINAPTRLVRTTFAQSSYCPAVKRSAGRCGTVACGGVLSFEYTADREPTPEWAGWTLTGPSSAEGCFLVAGLFVSGRACASPTLPGMMPFRVAIYTALHPQGHVGSPYSCIRVQRQLALLE